jgi:hypothetical protein
LTILNKISEYLKKDKIQRLLYGIGLLIWVIIWIDDLKLYNSESSLGIKYLWLMIIPTLLLIGQLILNNKIIWTLILGLISFYTIWTLWNIIFLEILVEFYRDYSPESFWNLKQTLILIIIFFVLFIVNWTIWKIKPNKNTLHNTV